MAKHIDGVLQGGAPIVLQPVRRVTRDDILAMLGSNGTWMKPDEIRMALPSNKWLNISPAILAARLRGMADSGEIERRYTASGKPEYKGLMDE